MSDIPEFRTVDPKLPTTLASWLRRTREEAGLSMGDVSRQVGISTVEISAYETGRIPCTWRYLGSFARLIDISVEVFFNVARTLPTDAGNDGITLPEQQLRLLLNERDHLRRQVTHLQTKLTEYLERARQAKGSRTSLPSGSDGVRALDEPFTGVTVIVMDNPITGSVPPQHWGRDHLSTLLYLETVCVDHQKFDVAPDPKMRTSPVTWSKVLWDQPASGRFSPAQAHAARRDTYIGDTVSRLHGAEYEGSHDDWDCCADLHIAGALYLSKPNGVAYFTLTQHGIALAHALRAKKIQGETKLSMTSMEIAKFQRLRGDQIRNTYGGKPPESFVELFEVLRAGLPHLLPPHERPRHGCYSGGGSYRGRSRPPSAHASS